MDFYTGSEHVAHVTVANPTSWDWVYQMTLHVGSMTISRTVEVEAGQSRDVDIPVTMPSSPATLPVSLTITETTTGKDLGSYDFGEISVIEEPQPDIEVTLGWY
jgi:hypothetical protein